MLLRIEQERVQAKQTWGIHDRYRMSRYIINTPGTLVDLAIIVQFSITCRKMCRFDKVRTCYSELNKNGLVNKCSGGIDDVT